MLRASAIPTIAVVLLAGLAAAPAASAEIFVVNTTTDSDPSGEIICDRTCTLREAVMLAAANGHDTPDTIEFYPTLENGLIRLLFGPLPPLGDVTIQGRDDGVCAPFVTLDAEGESSFFDTHGATTIHGVSIVDASTSGILTQSGHLTLTCSWLGLNHNGVPVANGIGITVDLAQADIGLPGQGNVISGNTGHGALLLSSQVEVRDTDFGTRPGFAVLAPNGGSGLVSLSSDLVLRGNLFQGNSAHGAYVESGAFEADVNSFMGNTATGLILISVGNGIVGSNAAVGNAFEGNGGPGVAITGGSTGNAVRFNTFIGNGGPAIDLGHDGATPDDAGDGDAGPNGLQNHGLVSFAGSGSLHIYGSLSSTPDTTFTIDAYRASTCGDAWTYVGNYDVTTDSAGDADLQHIFPFDTAPAGQFVVLTATGPQGTSEFTPCVEIAGSPTPVPELGALAFSALAAMLGVGLVVVRRGRC